MRHLVIYKNPRANEWRDDMDKYEPYYDDDDDYDDDKHYRRMRTSYYRADRHQYDDDDDYDYSKRYRSDRIDRYGANRQRNSSFVLPNEEVATLIMDAAAFGEYIRKHGYHFTTALADCASKMLVNSNNREHRWTADQVRQHLAMLGITDLGKCTLGDITFLANMAYADLYPEVLQSETACIKYAAAMIKDPDGYDGMVFSRWIADLIGRKITTIEWERYI